MLKLAKPLLGSLTLLIFPLSISSQAVAVELVGRAILPASTYATGPTSGQLITGNTNGVSVPFVNQQPVQGFSAVLPGPKPGTFLVMSDNGYGAKPNSADYVLRVYGVEPDFSSGQVFPVNIQTGERLSSFTNESFLQLNDTANKAGFPIVAEQQSYPSTTIPVDSAIKSGRLLTGGDFDIESFRRVSDGSYWFGDEFGPFLLHAASNGQLLEAPIPLPNFLGFGGQPLVQSPQNPNLADPANANLPRSRGFEGMALNTSGTKLYAMLEGALNDDPNRSRLLINEFDLATEQYTGTTFSYQMENISHAIGDLTAINDHEFIVIERDGRQGDPNNPAFTTPAQFKRLYKIDINQLDADGFVEKELLANLLNISDPNNIGGNGTTNGIFTFPFETIEDVLPVDNNTLLVINDNNYPFSVGRTPGQSDNNEFILIRIDQSLSVPEPSTSAALGLFALAGLAQPLASRITRLKSKQ